MTSRYFTSWVRRGAAAGILQIDATSGAYPGPATLQPAVTLAKDGVTQPVMLGPEVTLLGPGSVVGLDPRQVVRTDPAAGASAVEDNYLVSCEFARSDLPWLFTPASPSVASRLRPWLVLIVVNAATIKLQPGKPLARVTVPDLELPDLADSWAWAHAQVTVDGAEDVDTARSALDAPSGATAISRLLCPRRLQPATPYLACLVPSTRAGVLAGLGLPQEPGPALPEAWTAGSGAEVVLPVYYSWSFATGAAGDFKALVQRLTGMPPGAIAGFGTRTIDASDPWQTPPQLRDGLTFQLDGALATSLVPAAALPDLDRAQFEERLTGLLDFPAAQDPTNSGGAPGSSAVAPPIYAGRHVGQLRVPSELGWLRTLNLDPRRRIAAALGTRYVQDHQEYLMARAWDQIGAVREANRLRAQAEVAAEVADRLHARHILTLNPSELVSLAGPARARVVVKTSATLKASVAKTAVPAGVDTIAFRRLSRPLGPVGRRAFRRTPATILARGLANALTLAVPASELDGVGTALATGPRAQLTADATSAMIDGAWQTIRATEQGLPDPGDLSALRKAIDRSQPGSPGAVSLSSGMPTLASRPHVPEAADSALLQAVSSALLPSKGIVARANARIRTSGNPGEANTTRPIMAYPRFTAPLALALLREHPEYLLPGLGNFPDDRVTLLLANSSFVEAFLAGANHEINRELLWREYPTDQRGTPFQYFWPRPDRQPDIPPITQWSLGTALGANGAAHGPDVNTMLVLLVRGALLQRFPGTIVYAAPGKIETQALALDTSAEWKAPQFSLKLDAKTTAYAYALTRDDVHSDLSIGKAGWYFVFSEPLRATRFKFDEPSAQSPQRWTDLDWRRVPNERGFAVAGRALDVPPGEQQSDSPRWNRDAADIARIAFARPFRVGYHADELLAQVPRRTHE